MHGKAAQSRIVQTGVRVVPSKFINVVTYGNARFQQYVSTSCTVSEILLFIYQNLKRPLSPEHTPFVDILSC